MPITYDRTKALLVREWNRVNKRLAWLNATRATMFAEYQTLGDEKDELEALKVDLKAEYDAIDAE